MQLDFFIHVSAVGVLADQVHPQESVPKVRIDNKLDPAHWFNKERKNVSARRRPFQGRRGDR